MVQTRKDKHERQAEMLAAAIAIVRDHGVEQLTAGSLAESCGVSQQLVYAYFRNLTELQRQVLRTVFLERRAILSARLDAAEDLRQVVAAFVRSDVEGAASGSVIAQMESLPGVGSAIADLRAEDDLANGPYLFASVREFVELPPRVIELLLHVGSGASLAGAAYLRGVDVDTEAAIEATVEFVMGGVAAVGLAASKF